MYTKMQSDLDKMERVVSDSASTQVDQMVEEAVPSPPEVPEVIPYEEPTTNTTATTEEVTPVASTTAEPVTVEPVPVEPVPATVETT